MDIHSFKLTWAGERYGVLVTLALASLVGS